MSKKKSQEYRGHGEHDWEPDLRSGMQRLRVPGGWLYRFNYTTTTTLVPLPDVVKHKV
jgi:hypothetical protein